MLNGLIKIVVAKLEVSQSIPRSFENSGGGTLKSFALFSFRNEISSELSLKFGKPPFPVTFFFSFLGDKIDHPTSRDYTVKA